MTTPVFPNGIVSWADRIDGVDDANAADINTAMSEIISIENYLGDGTTVPHTLTWGYNNIRNNGKFPVYFNFSGKGQHYVNLLGKDGDCEDVSKWVVTSGVKALDSVNKVFGSNSLKVTVNNANGYGEAVLDLTGIFDETKYYWLSGFVNIGTGTAGTRIRVCDFGSGQEVRVDATVGSTGFVRMGVKINANFFTTANNVNVSVIVGGNNNNYSYFDGIMLNEISASDYALSETELLAKYPYGESFVCTRNPSLEIRRDNLVRNGNCEEGIGWWNTISSTLSIENKRFKLVTTERGIAYQKVTLAKNTTFYMKCNNTGGTFAIATMPEFYSALAVGNTSFNTGNNDTFYIGIVNDSAGTTYFDSVIISEKDIIYKPCDRKIYALDGLFTSDDTFGVENGKVTGLLNWKHRLLYGKDYDWQFNYDMYTGFKRLTLANSLLQGILQSNSGHVMIKYDGKPLLNTSATATADVFAVQSDGYTYLYVADSETGWAESINPNDDEVKAFMNGWKATANDGTRYTAWVSVVDGTTVPTSQTIDYVKNNIVPGYEGYRLHYKLQNPEPITDINVPVMGELWSELTVGDNYVFMDDGTVLGEVVNPVLSSGVYYINTRSLNNKFRNPVESILVIYKNGQPDTHNWTTVVGNTDAYGKVFAQIAAANFDLNATYTVDYVCLRSEAPQTIGTISGSYKTDLATGVAGVMAAVEEKQPRSSVLDMIEDLAIYEKGMSRSVNSWWMSTASTMIFDVYVFIQPKKITPMFNYKLSLVSVYGVPTASSFIFSNLAGYKLSDTAYLFRFYTNDNALINAIKTNGCELILEWEANCIRRI